VNAQVDDLITTGAAPGLGLHGAEVLERHDRTWWRSLKHQCLFLHSLR
jgi:hypothetical protein